MAALSGVMLLLASTLARLLTASRGVGTL